MSNLALYLLSKGIRVSGYDREQSEITNNLIAKCAEIFYEDQLSLLSNQKEIDIVVYTPAISSANNQLSYFLATHDFVVKRAELLGLITKSSFCIAVAGTHGKTTTSSIIAHMLEY